MEILKGDYKVEKRRKNILMIIVIIFFAVAYNCTGQEDRRIKIGDTWYSQALEVQQTDTIQFYGVFYPTAYQFSGIGITIKSKEKCIGKALMAIVFDSGITDYVMCFGEINCNGECYFRLTDTELAHLKTSNIKNIQITNQLYNRVIDIDMKQFRKDWYASVVKQ